MRMTLMDSFLFHRRDELAYKPLQYSKASAVLEDYKASYEKWRHKLLKVGDGRGEGAGEEALDLLAKKCVSCACKRFAI